MSIKCYHKVINPYYRGIKYVVKPISYLLEVTKYDTTCVFDAYVR